MSVAEMRKLSRTEKLKIIETLWSDLAQEEDDFESPAWHGEVLKQTEAEYSAGQIESLAWEDAKKELRSRFP
jgi:putative addiction module component (TIGR02574 family)